MGLAGKTGHCALTQLCHGAHRRVLLAHLQLAARFLRLDTVARARPRALRTRWAEAERGLGRLLRRAGTHRPYEQALLARLRLLRVQLLLAACDLVACEVARPELGLGFGSGSKLASG